MEFSELTIRLLFLFVPGIISTLIIDTLTSHRRTQLFQFIIHSFLLGMGSYLLIYIGAAVINAISNSNKQGIIIKTTFVESLFNSANTINVYEVIAATVAGVVLGLSVVKIINEKYLYKRANDLKLSNKHGEGDVWEYFLNSNDVQWVTVRDSETNILYQGAIESYSQKDDKRELVLSQVQVFKEINGQVIDVYKLKSVYLNFDLGSKIILEQNN